MVKRTCACGPVILRKVAPGALRLALAFEGSDEPLGAADEGFEFGGGVFAADDPEIVLVAWSFSVGERFEVVGLLGRVKLRRGWN